MWRWLSSDHPSSYCGHRTFSIALPVCSSLYKLTHLFQVKRTVALVREAVKHGKCVVIGLQSTGEAGTVDQLEKSGGQLNDFVSTAK